MNAGPSRTRLRELLLAAGLVLGTLAAYSRVAGHGFLLVDDNAYVTDNPHVQAGITPSSVGWAFTTSRAANWHPLTWLSHALDCQLFGLHPAGHHLASLLLHAASVLLLFRFLARRTGAPGRSAFVAALFALHPLHVESVAWVAERKDVLSGFFGIAALSAYARWVERPSRGRYGVVLAAYALGLLAKPMLVTLPFVLLLVDVWPLGRLSLRPLDRTVLRARILEKLPFALLAAIFCAITYAVQKDQGAMALAARIPFGIRIENALVSYVAYLRDTFWPSGLGVFYPHPVGHLDLAAVAGSALLLATATTAAWLAAGRRPYLLVGWLWYLGMLVPVIGIVQVGAQARADRYTYLPLIGIGISAAWGAVDAFGRSRAGRVLLGAAALACAGTWTVLTFVQVGWWKDDRALYERLVDLLPGNADAHEKLGIVHLRQGRLAESAAEFRAALAIDPRHAEAHSNLGMALELSGSKAEALAEYGAAVEHGPGLVEAHVNLGRLLLETGRVDEAIRQFRRALELRPGDAAARANLDRAERARP